MSFARVDFSPFSFFSANEVAGAKKGGKEEKHEKGNSPTTDLVSKRMHTDRVSGFRGGFSVDTWPVLKDPLLCIPITRISCSFGLKQSSSRSNVPPPLLVCLSHKHAFLMPFSLVFF